MEKKQIPYADSMHLAHARDLEKMLEWWLLTHVGLSTTFKFVETKPIAQMNNWSCGEHAATSISTVFLPDLFPEAPADELGQAAI